MSTKEKDVWAEIDGLKDEVRKLQTGQWKHERLLREILKELKRIGGQTADLEERIDSDS